MCQINDYWYDLVDMGAGDRDVLVFFYKENINRFVDDRFGNIIHDIYRYLTPSQIMLFKENHEYCLFPSIFDDLIIELVYMDDEEDEVY